MTDVPTTLLLNGRVHSPSHPDATAMAVRDGAVAWLGSDDVGRDQFAGADIVDLAGGFVAPAFVDSHIHLTATGLTLTGLDLRAATSLPHCLRLVADYAAARPGEPVWGHGWDESSWPEQRAAEHRGPRRRARGSAGLPGPGRRALGAGIDGSAAAGRRIGLGDRIRRTAAAGRRRPPPGPRCRA